MILKYLIRKVIPIRTPKQVENSSSWGAAAGDDQVGSVNFHDKLIIRLFK